MSRHYDVVVLGAGPAAGGAGMYLESLNATFVIDTFLLLLIGTGPKIALVPFPGSPSAGESCSRRPGKHGRMLIALLAVLGVNWIVIVVVLAVMLARRRWVSRQDGAFRHPGRSPLCPPAALAR